MPQYKKVFDIGTYTGNGYYYRVGIPTLRGVGPSGKQVANGLRFRSALPTYLTRVVGTPTNNNIYTLSTWFKKSSNGSNSGLFGAWSSSSTQLVMQCYFNTSDKLRFVFTDTSGNLKLEYITTQVFKDSSKWYHVLISVDNSLATTSYKLYIDGLQVTSFGTSTNTATQNGGYAGNKSGWNHYIGNAADTAGSLFCPFDGYMSETYMIDGQVLTPSSFGEYNSDGIWVPKSYSGSYTGNSYYLNYNGNAGTDASGLGGNFTPTGFNVTTANTSYDLMTDSPTDYLSGSMSTANNAGNYCIINPVDTTSSITISEGGLKFVSSATLGGARGTIGVSSGKWYWEVQYINGNSAEMAGIAPASWTMTSGMTGSLNVGYYNDGSVWAQGSWGSTGSAITANQILNIAVDFDAGKIWFGINGTWQFSGDPAAGTGAAYSSISSGTYFPAFGDTASGTNSGYYANFGQRPFAYTVPSGFKALNTYNYPRPADSSLWFYGDTPDLMWIKNRSTTGLHTITDTVRGPGLNLVTSSTAAQTSYPAVTEINKFGMSVINDGTSIVNGSGNGMIYWAWKKGVTPGFDIQTYTGDSNNNTLISHSLGAAPSFFITKNLDGYNNSNSFNDWSVYHTSLPSYNTTGSQALYLHSTNAAGAAGGFYQRPTSTKFTPNQTLYDNVSGKSYIAYLWAAIPGYSAFGSYTGNGSADGPFIYTGFRPRWVMVKSISNGGAYSHWFMFDSTRNTYNVVSEQLTANETAAGGSNTWLDFTSNGFKLRLADTTYRMTNWSGDSYIYAAFAEIPFKYARAR